MCRVKIHRVEIRTIAGMSWKASRLQGPVLDQEHTFFRHLREWKGGEAEIMSRAIDETGYVQPSRKALIAARGVGAVPYPLNPVTVWQIKPDGQVSFREEARK